jgi:hypothetical protein
MTRSNAPLSLGLLALLTAAACNRPPAQDAGVDEFDTDGTIPEGADVSPSCGDGIVQEGEFCMVLAENPEAGIDPCDLDVIDFNHDGRPDLGVPNSDPNITDNQYVANIMLGDGSTIGSPAAHDAGGALPVRSAAGDFNGDGHPDFAVSNYSENAINVLFGDGNGNFERGPQINCPGTSGDLAAGDLDGNGSDEIIAVLEGASEVKVYFQGQGNGAETIWLDSAPSDVEAADLDDDGRFEVLLPLSDRVEVHSRQSENSYLLRWAPASAFAPTGLKAGDLDDDGDEDLIAISMDGDLGIYEFQSGALTFAHAQQFSASFRDVAIADFDHMARADLALTDTLTNHVLFMRLGADDNYYQFGQRFTGSYPVAIVNADFNQDGHQDLATADQFSDRLSIWINRP